MRFRALAGVLAVVLLLVAEGQASWKNGIPLIVPGSELGWNVKEMLVVLEVKEPADLELQLYSPGFDPKDYRSPHELGDERYDQGKGELLSVYELRYRGRVIVRKQFGIEPHTWHRLFKGRLEPGEYTIAARFFGKGKNAVVFALKVQSGEARLLLAPGTMQTYNVVRGGWQTPFRLRVPEPSLGLKVGVYDGDGPKELEFRVRTPKGELSPPVPGDRAWTYVKTEEPGEYAFRFRIPETATQHTNTVGFKVDLGPIRVKVVDTEGNPVPASGYRVLGHYRRTVELQKPPGWELVDTQAKGGRVLAPGRVGFGMGAGFVRFVLKRVRPLGRLAVRARVACGDYRAPYPLRLTVAGRTLTLGPSGEAELALPAGSYPLSPTPVPGARIEGDARVAVAAGGTARAELLLRPEVRLTVRAAPSEAVAGRTVALEAEASTAFPGTLPARLTLELPKDLVAQGPTSIQAPLSADRSVRLKVSALAKRPGAYTVLARLAPCGGEARARIAVRRGAVFVLEKEAKPSTAAVGEPVAFTLRVKNVGDVAGQARLVDPAPPGFSGPSLDETLELAPGASAVRVLKGQVLGTARDAIVNRARLVQDGRTVAEAVARVRVKRPAPQLDRRLDRRVVLPGEEVRVCLEVQNRGQAPLRYRLTDTPPEWLAPEKAPSVTGELAPGARAEHCYAARARFGEPATGVFRALLESNAGRRTNEAKIRRVLLGLSKSVSPARVLLGRTAVFRVRVKNPLDRPVRVRLVDAPADGLGQGGFSRELELAPGEEKTLDLEAKPTRVGRLKNQVSAFIGETPAARPARAELEVVPPLRPERVSEVELPFQVEGRGDALILRHAVPAGAKYRPGSSRLDGKPVPDPLVDDRGRLYWKLPFEHKGVLRYGLVHRGPLPKLPTPELLLLAGGRAVPVQGSIALEDYRKAHPLPNKAPKGMIRWPLEGTVFRDRGSTKVQVVAPYGGEVELLVNGESVGRRYLGEARYDRARNVAELTYYGVPLKVGRNVLEVKAKGAYDRVEVFRAGPPVRLALVPERLVADGRSPIRLRIEGRDKNGLVTGTGFVTVEARPEPLRPDAQPREPGYQVPMKEGVAELVLKPLASSGEVAVTAVKDRLTAQFEGFAGGGQERLYLAQGSVTLRYGQGFELGGLARGYVETPLAGGHLQAAVSYAGGQGEVRPELGRPENPNGRFPLTGAGHEARLPLTSEDGVAFRYDRGAFSVGYGRLGLGLSDLVSLPNASVLAAEYRGPVRASAFVGLLARETLREVIVPDGTRIYRLSRPARPGSERVYLERGGRRERLEPLKDYLLDAPSGTLYLSRPLWPEDADFVSQRLVVEYAPESAPRDRVAAGAAVGYRRGGFSLEAAVASLDLGQDLRLGAAIGYRGPGFGVRVSYRLEAGGSTLGLTAEGERGPLSADANLRYAGVLSGHARVAYKLSTGGRAVLEHEGRAGENATRALYEQKLGKNLFAGLGGGYLWEEGAIALVGRLGYQDARARVALTHTQPFSVAPVTGLSASYAFGFNLTLKSELAYRWGQGLFGVLGLEQKLGPANLAVAYRLPGASGEGNRARFGIRAPLPIDAHWSLDLSAGYERSFASGESLAGAGVGVRYRRKGFSASFGVEGSTGTAGDKLSLRAGASGQINRRQVISFDANYGLLPGPKGRFTLAYAYRGRSFQVLTYHRYKSDENALEGELAPTWHPSLAFQLRPSAAYRIFFADPGGNTYQLGLGINYYFTRRLGIGAGGYYVMQPGTNTSDLAFSLEGSFRLLDPLWVNLGYTFGTLDGLTPESRPGLYLRLDFFQSGEGGGQ